MSKDVIYTNGVIAVKEKNLFGERLFRMCEGRAEDAFKTLLESGFGSGAEVESVYDFEKLTEADEQDLDAFIREYAPTEAEKIYLLAPRDFHNAKALLKAAYLGAESQKMLAPEGMIPLSTIVECIESGEYEKLGKELAEACGEAAGLLKEEGASGAEIGGIFERALYKYLDSSVSKRGCLRKLFATKADMTNLLTAFRSVDPEYAEKMYVAGGTLKAKAFEQVFSGDEEAFKNTAYADFAELCFKAKAAGKPFTEAEKFRDSYETEFLKKEKYELKNNQPFLYYVFRRRAENANIRIIFVCLNAGMSEQEVKKRLRTF